MNSTARRPPLVETAEFAGFLILVRLALPTLLTWITNRAGARLRGGYRLHVRRVAVNFAAPGLIVEDVRFDHPKGQALAIIYMFRVDIDWRSPLNGNVTFSADFSCMATSTTPAGASCRP